MRILHLTSKPPFPPIDGGCKAMAALAEAVRSIDAHADMFTFSTYKHPFHLPNIPDSYKNAIHYAKLHTKPTIFSALVCLVKGKSYNLSRFYKPEIAKRILNLIEKNKYDVVLFDSLYVMPYIHAIQGVSAAKTIYRAHNIEYTLWESQAKKQTNPILAWYYGILAKQLKKEEFNLIKTCNSIACISQEDAVYLKRKFPSKQIVYLPFSINLRSSVPAKTLDFYFLGSFEWLPNVEGLRWFIEQVWPDVVKKFPDACLHIAGKACNINEWQGKQIRCYGEVPDADAFIAKFTYCIAPILSGGGVRIKVLEAMAAGKIIFATTKAVEGLSLIHRKHACIANNTEEFVACITEVLKDSGLAGEIATGTRSYIEQHHSHEVVGNILRNLIQAENE